MNGDFNSGGISFKEASRGRGRGPTSPKPSYATATDYVASNSKKRRSCGLQKYFENYRFYELLGMVDEILSKQETTMRLAI